MRLALVTPYPITPRIPSSSDRRVIIICVRPGGIYIFGNGKSLFRLCYETGQLRQVPFQRPKKEMILSLQGSWLLRFSSHLLSTGISISHLPIASLCPPHSKQQAEQTTTPCAVGSQENRPNKPRSKTNPRCDDQTRSSHSQQVFIHEVEPSSGSQRRPRSTLSQSYFQLADPLLLAHR